MKAKIKRVVTRSLQRRGYDLTRKAGALLGNPGAELRVSLELAATHFACLNGGLQFVQVGAYDGITFDPLRAMILRHGWKGILLEPQPDAFKKLCHNYRDQPQLMLKNAAVTARDEVKTLYRASEKYYRDHQKTDELEWVRSCATFDVAPLLTVPNISGYIEEIEVEGICFESLLQQCSFERVDLLQIDAEGYDYEILKMFDVPRRRPSIVNFEHSMLSTRDRESSLQMLIENGYQVAQIESDTLAYLKSPSR